MKADEGSENDRLAACLEENTFVHAGIGFREDGTRKVWSQEVRVNSAGSEWPRLMVGDANFRRT